MTSLTYTKTMIQPTVGNLNTNHSELLNSVIQGEDIEIFFRREKRNIGTLDYISSFSEIDDGKITIKEFLKI